MAYKAPVWEDGKSPAISAENLNNLSQAAEGAQVLYGNSAPISSTEGAVGQFYLVVVADSDGNYPLYQCVAIANGSYMWRDTRRIPDSITSMLGIPAPGTINRALNVLANVGNLHVWERVQTYSNPVPEVPAGYTLGEVETDVVVSNQYTSSHNLPFDYATELNISSDGTISLKNPSTREATIANFGQPWVYSNLAGHFFVLKSSVALERFRDVIWYMPEDGTASVSESGSVSIVTLSKMQSVSFRPYTPAIPAGTTTDYLTSTDRNAYPDKSAEGGEPEKPAHYTLDEAETVDVLSSSADYSATLYSCDLDSVLVNNDGSISTTNFSVLHGGSNILNSPGSWASFSPTEAYYITSGSDNVVFTDTIFTVSEETTLTHSGGKYVLQGCRKLIGHAKVEAIPSNTTITYLGQLGGGARIEVGSYVGTGTYGSSNPNTLTFGFEPKFVHIAVRTSIASDPWSNPFTANYIFGLPCMFNDYYVSGSSTKDYSKCNVTVSGNTMSWYNSKGSDKQMNTSGYTYNYIAIG